MASRPGIAFGTGKGTSVQTKVRRGWIVAVVGGTALAFGAATFPGGIGAMSVSAQDRHYARGGCLPYLDDLDCADIGDAVIEVWDVYDDPYELDVLYGPGNGWTCDGVD
jgi:hypothetical protein